MLKEISLPIHCWGETWQLINNAQRYSTTPAVFKWKKKILDPIEASGNYFFLSRENAITQTSSLFYPMIFNYFTFMSLVQLLTSRIIASPFLPIRMANCWTYNHFCRPYSAGSEQVSVSICPSSDHLCENGDGIALILHLENLNIKWLVKTYRGKSMHSISFLKISSPHSSFLYESLKWLLLQFSLKSDMCIPFVFIQVLQNWRP